MQIDKFHRQKIILLVLAVSMSLSFITANSVSHFSPSNIDYRHTTVSFSATTAPRINFTTGDFVQYDVRSYGALIGEINTTYSHHLNDTHVLMQSEYSINENHQLGNMTLNLYSREIENESSSMWEKGTFYPLKIETNLTVGDDLSILTDSFTVYDESVYVYRNNTRNVWTIRNGSVFLTYDMETGILLEYFSNEASTYYILTDTNEISPGYYDASIHINVENKLLVNYTSSISIQLGNEGTCSEIVNYSIWINNSKFLEGSFNIPYDTGFSTFEDISYPKVGLYNITAIVSVSNGEDVNLENNRETEWVEVVSEPAIEYEIGDYMTYQIYEVFFDGPMFLNITYYEQIDECHVRLTINENGSIYNISLETVTLGLNIFIIPFSSLDIIFFLQRSTQMSIGSTSSIFLFTVEIVDEIIFQYNGVGLNAWVGSFGDHFAYYHKDTGVLLAITNSTHDIMAELTETSMINTLPPDLSSPSDLLREYDESTFELEWMASDPDPTNYTITCNGTTLVTGEWTNSTAIACEIGDFLPGIYNLTLSIYNAKGLATTDSVIVEVVDTISPILTHPDDIDLTELSDADAIIWNVSDLLPDLYQVFQDGNLVFEGDWSTLSQIEFDLENLTFTEGTYEIELCVYDTSGNVASDTVIVHVSAASRTIGISGNVAFLLISGQIIAAIMGISKFTRKNEQKK